MPSSRCIARIALVIVTVATVSTFPIESLAQGKIGDCGNNLASLQEAKLDVLSELTINDNLEAKFRISFLDIGTNNVHKHIDYTFAIEDQSGKEIFNAGPSSQPVLHTAEGVVTIPYHSQSRGDYTANVTVYGVNFVPVNPESATFPCNDIPEFPVGTIAIVTAIIGTLIVVSRIQKLRGRLS